MIEPEFSTKYSLILVGNAGAGKSSLLNMLAGRDVFQAGYSADQGLTMNKGEVLAQVGNDVVTLINLPGVREKGRMNDTLCMLYSAINDSFKKKMPVKIVFVARLEAGRPVVEDLTLVNIVIKASQNTREMSEEREEKEIHVLFNKCSRHDMESAQQQTIKSAISSVFAPVKAKVQCHFIRRGIEDALPTESKEDFVGFLNSIQAHQLYVRDLVDEMLNIVFESEKGVRYIRSMLESMIKSSSL